MNTKHVQWLYNELPTLVSAGVLSEGGAEAIREHFGPVKAVSPARVALTLFSILGGLMIGAGIILLLAYNWTELGRPVRAVLSFLPLVIGQGLVGWTLLRKWESKPWREGSSGFLAMGIGASIALVGQTYHIPGNMANFLFVWLLLGLPLVYLCRSTVAAFLYIVGTAAWTIAAQDIHGHALWYWPLLACVLPFIWTRLQRQQEQPSTALLLWSLCLSLCLGLGVAMEKVLPGLWIITYSCLFALFCLGGRVWYRDVPSQPLSVSGSFGTVILALLLTFSDFWRRIGFNHYRGGNGRYLEWFGIQDYLLVLLLLSVVVILAVRAAARKDFAALAWCASPVIAVVGYGIGSVEGTEDIPAFLYNLLLFGLGVFVMSNGIREGRLAVANGGMGILALLFTVRFFDSDMAIIVRGVAFIAIGIGFLGANIWLSRRLLADNTEVQS
jgi:uncharacterized membrane protein